MTRPSRGSHPSRTDWLCAGPLSTGRPRPAPGGRRHAPVREERARAFESCVAARVCQKLPVPQHLEVAASSLLKIPRAVLSSRWSKFERRVKGTERPRTAHRRENVGSSGSAARTPRPRGRCPPRRGAGRSGRRLATAARPPPYCHTSSYMLLRRNLGYEGHKTRLRTNPVTASTPRVGVSLSHAPRP